MTESTINPSPITIRKAKREGGEDYVFVYLRHNLSKKQVEDIDGETATFYEYDEVQLCIPIDVDIDLSATADHAYNQDALKRALKRAILADDSLHQQLSAAMVKAKTVGRKDNLSTYEDSPPVDVSQQRQWAEALCVILAPQDVSGLQTEIVGEYRQLVDVGNYRLWTVNAPVDILKDLHTELWAMQPAKTLGLLAVVGMFGENFLPSAVRDAVDMTQQEALGRRDRIADYLDGLGCDTARLCAATDEHEQIEGIARALGYLMRQLWEAMRD